MDELEDQISIDPAGFFSIKNIPSAKELAEFYSKFYFQDERVRSKTYQETYDEQERKHITLLNDLCLYALTRARTEWENNPGSMLEIGSGEGFFLSRALERGWDVHGIDFNSYALQKFNPHITDRVKIGNAFDIITDFERQGKRFDVCIIYNVLEHVIDPRKLLESLRNLLNPNGIIVVNIPNDFSKLQLRAHELNLINKKFWIIPPHHLHYFNTINIRTFMAEMRFQIIDMYSSFPIDFFLFHPGSNYVMDEKNGKPAHRARIELDLIMADAGFENYHRLCQALALCNVGRNLTVILKQR